MQSIIEQIFLQTLESGEEKFQRQQITDKEFSAYEAIREHLSDEDKKLFDNFEEASSARYCESEQEMYFFGFRMGARMAFEIMNADFSLKF